MIDPRGDSILTEKRRIERLATLILADDGDALDAALAELPDEARTYCEAAAMVVAGMMVGLAYGNHEAARALWQRQMVTVEARRSMRRN